MEHSSPEEREITEEITLVNNSEDAIEHIFLFRDEFMLGLKVLDEEEKELALYTNELTRQLLYARVGPSPDLFDQYRTILRRMDRQELFVLWIRLPEGEEISANQSKIIKLRYRNKTKPFKRRWWRVFNPSGFRFLYSIPRFRTVRKKPAGTKYESFYVIKVPEGYSVEHKVLKNVEVVKGKETDLERHYESYKDRNKHMLSIRPRSTEEESRYDMFYDVLPDRGDRWFYGLAVLSLIVFSAIVTGIAMSGIDSTNVSSIIKRIYENSDTLHAGTITAALSAIGFIRNPSLNRTRFFFLGPVVISALGFFAKHPPPPLQ